MACWNEQRMDANRREKDGCTRRIVKGLRNVGNTCFFNSVLQNLLAVDGLRDHFTKPTQFSEGPITSALRKLYVETSSEGLEQRDNIEYEFPWFNKGNVALNPDVLFHAICAKVPQFRGFNQQDSHELLRCLLDNLHTEELLNFSHSKPTNCGDGEAAEGNSDESSNQRNDATLVDRVFQGQLCSTVCCSKCGYQSVTYEPFHDLSLSIPSEPEPIEVSWPHQKDPSSSKTKWKNGDGTIAKSDFGLFGGSESPISYKEMHSIAGEEVEVTQLSAELNTDDALDDQEELDVSVGLDSNYDILHIFDNDESSTVQENKIDVSETESPLYGENDEDNLFKGMSVITETREADNLFKSMPVITETWEERRKAAVIPMSVEGCLLEFTRPETLSGENGWKCSNCASKLVNGFDNLANTTAKEEQGMGFNGRLNAGPVQNIADSIMDRNRVEKSNLLKELEVFCSERCLETSDTKKDEYQLHSGSVTGSEADLNDNACQQTEVLCILNDIDNGQPSNQEDHRMRRGIAGHNSVPVYDISAQGVSCSDAEGHSGAEERSEIDGINHAERPASTCLEEEGGRISANFGESFTSSGGGHRLKKRRSKTMKKRRSKKIKHEANSNGILQEATKRYLISKTPPTLTIHLKRFKHGLFGRLSKLDGHVHFQERLDLTPYMDSRSPDKDKCIYRLIGVVRHEGSMAFGHYVAYVRCDQDGSGFQWFYVSDDLVKEVSMREVLQSEAYILFYEKL